MFGWIEKKFAKSQRDEAETFVLSLRGADAAAIDIVSAQTMYWANFHYARGINLYDMEAWILGRLLFPVELGKEIKSLQKGGAPASTVGLQVWLHSSRALLYPELRLFGRQVWAEITQASPMAAEILLEMHRAANSPPTFSDSTMAPSGLEPNHR